MSCEPAIPRPTTPTTHDSIGVLFARHQRNRYTAALGCDPGVLEVLHTGTLPPETAPSYVKDVHLLVVLPEPVLYRLPPGRALKLTQDLIQRQVPDTALVNGLIRCGWATSTPPGPLEQMVGDPSPVDVRPGYRQGSRLRVPDRNAGAWLSVDPEPMIRMVAERQRQWNHFGDLARMTRAWNRHRGLGLTSVGVDVLTLTFMPRPQPWQSLTRAEAVARFLQAAAGHPGLGPDDDKLRRALGEAAELARAAVDAATDGNRPRAERLWEALFGDAFGPGWLLALLRWTWGEPQAQHFRADVHADWPPLAA